VGGEAATESAVEGGAAATRRAPARLTMTELEHAVQASAAELREGLRNFSALCVDDGWCVLDAQLELDVMETVLALCVEREWPLAEVPVAECVAACVDRDVDGFDETAVRHCLRSHSSLAATGTEWDAWLAGMQAETLSLDPQAVCRFRARALLAECDAWPRAGFLEAWREGLPPGVPFDPTLLDGLAVTLTPADANGKAVDVELVHALPLASLPSVAKERFRQLFSIKREWNMKEFQPYVQDIVEPGRSAEALVLEYARAVIGEEGTTTYVINRVQYT